MTTFAFTINDKAARVEADANTPLLWVVREHLKMTGTKFGCRK
jgi:isoquinoline 1-oxidoreductase alpha subunit